MATAQKKEQMYTAADPEETIACSCASLQLPIELLGRGSPTAEQNTAHIHVLIVCSRSRIF